jgi:hypothetical protein
MIHRAYYRHDNDEIMQKHGEIRHPNDEIMQKHGEIRHPNDKNRR